MWRIALAAVLTACLAAFALNAPRVHAQFNGCQAGFCNPAVASGGGGSISFSGTQAVAKTGCGGGFTCTDTITIGAGLVVMGAQASGTFSAMSVCGTSLSRVATNGNATSSTEMWAGVISGCSGGNISVTTTSGFGNFAYAVGLITGYTSATNDFSCTANYPGSQGSPYACNSGTTPLTINASGLAVGIGVASSEFGSGVTACSPTSCDKNSGATGGYASAIWHWTSNSTPQYSASNNDIAGLVAASWH